MTRHFGSNALTRTELHRLMEACRGTDPLDPASHPSDLGIRGGGGPAGCAVVSPGTRPGAGPWALALLLVLWTAGRRRRR